MIKYAIINNTFDTYYQGYEYERGEPFFSKDDEFSTWDSIQGAQDKLNYLVKSYDYLSLDCSIVPVTK